MQRIAERQAQTQPVELQSQPDALADLDRRFTELRDELMGLTPPGPQDTEPDETQTSPGLPEILMGRGPTLELPDTVAALSLMAGPLRHGKYLDRLAGVNPSRFNELMSMAEESLRDGEYFWAERRFERALRFIPGHPLAIAGLGHAQIGAGFHLPAALTLRRLMVEHPEMIDVRYDPKLLPSAVRLSIAVERLRELIARIERDRDLHSFLLAYIGHQLDDRQLIAEGLQQLSDGPLRTLLEAVWLGEESQAPDP